MAGHRLSIDLGTTNTVAMLGLPDGRIRSVVIDGSPLLPSAVHVSRGRSPVVGRDALRAALGEPGGLEPNPKRRIDDGRLLLGGAEVTVAAALAAVLGRVVDEARRVTDDAPAATTLTFPAAWGARRRGVLVEAAALAGIDAPRLLPEPVAAVHHFREVLGHRVRRRQALVVFDFGAGTVDVSVLRRTGRRREHPDGPRFDVVATGGLDTLGGLDLDEALVRHVGTVYGERHPEAWQRLASPQTLDDLRHRTTLWDEIRAAKETLSRQTATTLYLPIVGDEVPLGREEFERLTAPMIRHAVETAAALLRGSRVDRRSVAAVLLVGGSSRIPLVATMIHRLLGVAPTMPEQPELVVAEGALHTPDGAATFATTVTEPPVAHPALSGYRRPNDEPPTPPDPWPAVTDPPPTAPRAATPPVEPPAEPPPVETQPAAEPLTPPDPWPAVAAASAAEQPGGDDRRPTTPVPEPEPSGRVTAVALLVITLVLTTVVAVAGLLSGDADGGRGPGTGTSRTAAQAAPTAIGLGDALLSNRSIAKQGKGSVTFVDPRTGAEEESISIAVGSPNRIGTVSHTVIVDVEDGGPDTLVAFFFSVVVPEQGLNPRREERRVQVYSRRTRQRIVDTNTPQAPPRGSSDTTWMSFRVIGVDPKGYVVLTVPDAIGTSPFVYTQGIRPGLPSRVVDPGYSPPRLTGVGVHGGVLLTTRFTAVGIELSGFDIGSGTRLWRRTVDARDEPRCVAGRADTFVVMGAGIPLVLNARTGATVVEGSVPACLTIDPTTATGVQTSSGLAGYDLGTAEKLWSLPSSQTSGVGLSVRSVYGGRVYVTTRTSRLVLDARTGRQVEAGWTQAPKAAYDGWSVWSTDKGALVALPTPLGSSPPR